MNIFYLLAGFFLFSMFLLIYFYRDPEREIPRNGVVSPADGRVIEISKIKMKNIPIIEKNGKKIFLRELKDLITEDSTLISIFMSPFDAHVNRAPISGKVLKIIYKKGKFSPAKSPVYAENERNLILIEGKDRMVVIQVAGIFARRIQCYLKVGNRVEKGERIGRIVFSSQVVLVLSSRYEILVLEGEHVKAGESVLAVIGEERD
ncbi:MAG: phosphatidylserine decarboxylase [Candidatus Methanofastidiosia archaeon]